EGAGAGTAGDPAHYIGIVSNVYGPGAPVVTKSPALDAGIDGSAILASIAGDFAYAVTTAGTVYAIKTADGTISWQRSVGSAVSWSTPWIDFVPIPPVLYVADLGGKVTAINSSTGAVNHTSPAIGSPIHSSPIVFNNMVWVGADDGKLYRFNQTD